MTKKRYWHASVGAILINQNGKILLFERTRFPVATVFPAGHIEVGERPDEALLREVEEETGIKLQPRQATLLGHEILNSDSCRRGSDDHEWWVYIAHVNNPQVSLASNEGINPLWQSINEVKTTNMLIAAKYILEKYIPEIKNHQKPALAIGLC
jgi:8-oxo-dGTP pyrophosphatase MutT (NUDIX family)